MFTPEDVTFYVPCYNVAGTIEVCLEGILSQDKKIGAVLLVDDGSDQPVNLAINHAGVDVISHVQNLGLASARNTALRACHTRLISGIDADVVLAPDWLEHALQVMNHHAATGVGGNMSEHHEKT